MKKTIFISLGIIVILMGSALITNQIVKEEDHSCGATCYGNSPCYACSSCKYCAHCTKGGGSCGICR